MKTNEEKLRIIENAILIGYYILKDYKNDNITIREYLKKMDDLEISALEQLEDEE